MLEFRMRGGGGLGNEFKNSRKIYLKIQNKFQFSHGIMLYGTTKDA